MYLMPSKVNIRIMKLDSNRHHWARGGDADVIEQIIVFDLGTNKTD